MNIDNKNVLIIGMAKSGISAAKLCHKLGANVSIYDGKDKSNFVETITSLESFDFNYFFGEFDKKYLTNLDLLVLSPGVPTDLDFINKARDMGIMIIGEIELSYNFCNANILAITGTNGKTTTTSLLGEIMAAVNDNTYVVGNIGNPFSDIVLDTNKNSTIVAEISSFQLESIIDFKPKVSAILNITEDHLNRHKTLSNYANTKLKITQNQNNEDFCILNFDDKFCRSFENKINSQIIWFSMTSEVEGVYFKNSKLISNINGEKNTIISLEEIKLLGKHNIENILSAIAVSLCMNVPIETIKNIIKEFKAVEHRIEYVKTINGVKYYNDSKATNPDAAIKGIDAMITPTILIGGGMDKGSTFDEWINCFNGKVKSLVVFGETAENIKDTAKKCNFNNVSVVKNLEEAVEYAYKVAINGDSVLLSPACASWDMFKSYEERGNLFKKLIKTL